METFTKYTLSFLGFCALQMLCFVPLAGMQSQEEKIKADFFKKIEAGDLEGVKALIEAGVISNELLFEGYSKLDGFIINYAENDLYKRRKAISDYIGSIGRATLKFYHSQSSPSSSSSHSGNAAVVSSDSSSMSCLAQSSIAPVMSSSSHNAHEAVFSNSNAPAIAVQSSSSLPSIAESADEGLQQGVMMSLAPADSNLIPEAEEHSSSVHAEPRSNCCYTLVQAFLYFCTVAFLKEKSV